jgi:hypothetical protein
MGKTTRRSGSTHVLHRQEKSSYPDNTFGSNDLCGKSPQSLESLFQGNHGENGAEATEQALAVMHGVSGTQSEMR